MEALAYTYAHDHPDAQASFFMFRFRTQYLPYFLIFLTFVQAGQAAAMSQATGLISAHLYLFLTTLYPQTHRTGPVISTPAWLSRMLPGGPPPLPGESPPYTVFNNPAQEAQKPSTRKFSWGQGRRLGE